MPADIMDNNTSTATDRRTTSNINGSVRRPTPIITPHGSMSGTAGRPASLMDSPNHSSGQYQIVRVIVNKDEKGYGMKVSGDNPVYVQGIKQGGAAEKAGLHAGDKIMEVNGINVMSSTHTEVVSLIRSSSQVVLTVQQRTGALRMGSPSLHNRPFTTHSPSRITGPQPVDHEKLYQLQLEREQHFRLMIEKEERYLEALRSQLARSPDDKKFAELEKTERNLQKLQGMLQSHVRNQNEQTAPSNSFPVDTDTPPPLPRTPPPNLLPPKTKKLKSSVLSPVNDNEAPPPLPKRTRHIDLQNSQHSYVNGKFPLQTFLAQELNANVRQAQGNSANHTSNNNNDKGTDVRDRCDSLEFKAKSFTNPNGVIMDNALYSDPLPPPLPPRAPASAPPGSDPEAVNSINKQMSYPLVATCATLINNYSPNHTHHRTKSSPESLSLLSPAEASRRLIASESMSDLRGESYDSTATPPGTPPPPYPSPLLERRQLCSNRSSANTDEGDMPYEECIVEPSSPDISPLRGSGPSPGLLGRVLANSSPIHAANPQTTQQSIMSMEDDEISDQEVSQLEDHGPFKSLSRLWEHTPHLAVFMNYVLSNSDPNSLLFYLLTDLYKEGNAKEMRKWAYEIHSSFLVPGAPLRLSNVDENIAHEIDDVLTREFDKEEILRKIFWKARNRAKEELTKQLSDFQQKRTAGLGTIFGPPDSTLLEITHDKAKEMKMYENLFLDKLEPYLEEVERENYDPRKYYTAAALTTVITRVFGVRPAGHALDRCPTFVNKEKSFRTKFIGRYSRKLNVQGHQFVAQQYYTVIACNHCHQIIYGIGPQGYQCSVCLINLHRLCVKLYEDTCPGPINKRDRGIQKLMVKIRPEHKAPGRKQSSHFIQMEKERRMQEEKDNGVDSAESGDTKPGHPVTRTGSDRRPDAVREESSKTQDSSNHTPDNEDDTSNPDTSKSLPATTAHKRRNTSNINRSESVKEQPEKRKQRRNISDPLHNNTSESVDIDNQGLYQAHSGSSSNTSLSSRSSNDSPSSSLDTVSTFHVGPPAGTGWDSDIDIDGDPPDWQSSLTEEELNRLQSYEKKRQDVINEVFQTERSHLRNLRVLEWIFFKPIHEHKHLKTEEINLVFSNLSELAEIHSQFNMLMKNKKKDGVIVKEVGDILTAMFDGNLGETFQRAAATFCERQQLALEFIKEKRRRDTKFDNTLNEFEKSIHCRRLPLQSFIPMEMQRLSKYPLLLERLIDIVEKNVENDTDYSQVELSRLQQAHDRSKIILNHVNEAAKQAVNKARLEEIQNHLDTSQFDRYEFPIVNEFKNLDITKYNLIHEGPIQLKRQNKVNLQVHMVLLEEVVILLQREGDRYVLKFFQTGIIGQAPLSPIIKMSTLLVRTNAALKSSLFLVNTSTQNSQMYELLARDSSERKTWFKHLSDAAEAYNKREGKSKRPEPAPDAEEETLHELPSAREAGERAESIGGVESTSNETENSVHSAESSQRNSDVIEDERDKRLSQSDSESNTPSTTPLINTTGGGVSMKFAADDWPLIQPSEVQVEVAPVHTAEPVLTPIEQIKRKGEEVRQALEDKEKLVADLLSIPRDQYHYIADMASEDTRNRDPCDREPTELVLAAVYQADQLLAVVNESLSISDVDSVLLTGGKHPSCASNETLVSKNHMPSVPVHRLQDIATTLSSQLTTLLSVTKHRDEERDRLRKELQRTREQLHEKLSIHGSQYSDVDDNTAHMDSTQSGDLESIEESPTENEST